MLELERHRSRVRKHVGRRPETDALGAMLRARSQSIAEAQIEAIEQAHMMLERGIRIS